MKNLKILVAVLAVFALFVVGCSDNQNLMNTSDQTPSYLTDLSLITLPTGAVLNSATLGLYVDYFDYASATHNISIHRVTAPWDENTVTFNSFGGSYDPAVVATISATGQGLFYTADVTSLVQGWLDGDYPDYGIFLMQQEEHMTAFGSSEFADIASRPSL